MAEQLEPLPEDWHRAVAIVAHPDDMEFGAAAAVARWTAEGKSVVYVIATRGEAGIDTLAPQEATGVREAEQRASAAVVGVSVVEFLDHPDGCVEYGLPLRRDFAAAIRRHRPEVVIGFGHHDTSFTGRWNSPDHRHTGRAVIDAVGDAANRWVFRDLDLEPWSGVKYLVMSNSPHATHAVDVSSTIDTAVASLECHAAYLDALRPRVTEVRGPLLGMATAVGRRFGGVPAVAFELIRR